MPTPPEAVAALEQEVLGDLNALQQVQESRAQAERRDVIGARLFRQLPEMVLAVGAAAIAGVALAGLAATENAVTQNKETLAKDHQPTD